MPNPELSQYHDHDTDTLYDIKDGTARTDIRAIKKEIMAVLYMNVIALAQDYSFVVFELNPGLIGMFDETQDGDCIRCIFPHFENADVYPDIPIKFSWGESLSPKFSFVYKDYAHNDKLKWSDVDNKVLDFVYRSFNESFVVVISPASVNADDVFYDNTLSGLLSSNVQEAINELSADKADSSALATVATSGDYDDLLNKPTIPAAQVQADWTEADNTKVDYIKNKPTIPAAQVNSDWNANSGVAEILNKPSLASVATSGNYNDLNYKPTFSSGTGINIRGSGSPGYNWDYEIEFTGDADDVDYDNSVSGLSATNVEEAIDELAADKADASSLATVATSGDYDDLLNKPTIPAAQVQSDWTEADNTKVDYIKNKPSLAAVATSGNYNDLTNKLSAGTNISISASNEISATDTKPSDYNGQNSLSAVSVANGTSYVELAHVDLTAGTWIVNWAASFPSAGSSNTGYRAAGLATTGDPYAYMSLQVPAVANNTFTCLSGSALYVATGNITLRLKARQYQGASGSALNVTPRLQAIKIL